MKRYTAILTAGMFVAIGFVASAHAQQTPVTPAQSPQTQTTTTKSSQKDSTDSVAEAARKARAQQKKDPAMAKTFTNDDIPEIQAASPSVGLASSTPPVSSKGAKAADGSSDTKAAGQSAEVRKDEAYWRKRFTDLRSKLELTEKELDVLQRELNLNQRQFYSDPNQALQQQYSRDDINQKTDKIAAKQKEVDDLKQQLSDLEDALRKSGGDPAWGR
jgi:chromosome segregation ATPase